MAPPTAKILTSSNENQQQQLNMLWNDAASQLRLNGGVAVIDLPPRVADLHRRCFEVAGMGLDAASTSSASADSADIKSIRPTDDAAHATGYHTAGSSNSLSRYNDHREGFVFSDGEMFDVPLPQMPQQPLAAGNEEEDANFSGETSTCSFRQSMDALHASLHDGIASNVLRAIGRDLGLAAAAAAAAGGEDEKGKDEKGQDDWFQDALGPTGNASQWHVKRYVDIVNDADTTTSTTSTSENNGAASATPRSGDDNDNKDNNKKHDESDEEIIEWLPVHTDPSLISIVVHDMPGKNVGAMGLQYLKQAAGQEEDDGRKKEKVWTDVPYHGHAVATVFVGSVLSYITGGYYPAAKHRVVYNRPSPVIGDGDVLPVVDGMDSSSSSRKRRVAATLFVRPRGDAKLVVPPSSKLLEGGGRPVKVRNTTFDAWVARVSKNYMKNSSSKNASKTKNKTTEKEERSSIPTATKKGGGASPPLVWSDDLTELTLHPCTPPLRGQEKFLGGELSPLNGKMYAIPGHAPQVLEINPTVEPPVVRSIGPNFKGEFKWLRGIAIGRDAIYGIPCHADSILKIIPSVGGVKTISWDFDQNGAPEKGLQWKWHGGELSPIDGCFYAIPQAADYVMKLDPNNDDEVTFIGPPFPGRNLWYGGLVGDDGCIYGIPQNATGVLKIDPVQQTATLHGSYPAGGYKWHGGVKGPDGCIYGIPAHADAVLKLTPGPEPTVATIGGPLRTGRHRKDGKYKYLGGAVGVDGNVYFFPSDADYVLQINPRTDVVREVGPNLRDLEPLHNNKWQNGFSSESDGCIYGIPLKATTILRIRPKVVVDGEEEYDPEITTIGGPYTGLNKWEGGIMSRTGDMYCMPLNFPMVLRIRPASS